MAKIAAYALDPKKSDEGVWFLWAPKLYIKIGRADTAAFTKRVQAMMRPSRSMRRAKGTSDEELIEPYWVKTMAEQCITDWGASANGQPDADGKAITDAEQWELDWNGDGKDPYDRHDDAVSAALEVVDLEGKGKGTPAVEGRTASLRCTFKNLMLLFDDPRFEDLKPFCIAISRAEANFYVAGVKGSAEN